MPFGASSIQLARRRRALRRGANLRDVPDARDRDFASLGLASSALPAEALELDQVVPGILDQGGTSSCVAHAIAGAIHTAEAHAGLPVALVSRRALYYQSRRYHDERRFLRDSGTYNRTCVKALAAYGVPDERHFPWRPLRINQRPGWQALRYAHPRRGGEYLRIFETGSQRVLAVRAALAAGHPVIFGTALADSFLHSGGPDLIGLPTGPADGPIVGRHAMYLTGYRTAETGRIEFRVVNSWGTGWRDHGRAWLTSDYLAWSQTDDLWIVRGWKRLREASE